MSRPRRTATCIKTKLTCEYLRIYLLLNLYLFTGIIPRNIPICSNVKIIELGQSRHLTPGDQIKIQYTTAEYAAPEIHQCDMVSTVTDMWSVGVLAYVLLSGLNPFTAETNQQTIDNISSAAYSYDDESFKQVSVEALDFTDRLMTKERKHRMTAAEALAHPWLTKPAEEISVFIWLFNERLQFVKRGGKSVCFYTIFEI
uniref:Protein kinase domain-containing protein n=1 Tax=Neolamprologus brichardi TaxID=32507 RepID=A0A3Q4I3T8_NEOBR